MHPVRNPPFSISALISETLRERVVIYLQLCNLQEENVLKTSAICDELRTGLLFGLAAAETNFGVLVRSDCSEGSLWEGESLENTPTDAEQVVCLDNVETGVVAMHRMQNDLQTGS